jgi:hypothetical protein
VSRGCCRRDGVVMAAEAMAEVVTAAEAMAAVAMAVEET